MAFEGRDDRFCKVGSGGWTAGRVVEGSVQQYSERAVEGCVLMEQWNKLC